MCVPINAGQSRETHFVFVPKQQMNEGLSGEYDEVSVRTPPYSAPQKCPDLHQQSHKPHFRGIADPDLLPTVDPSGLREQCFAFSMDRALRPPMEPPLFATLRGLFWNDCVTLLANPTVPVQGSCTVPGTQPPAASTECARAVLEGDCLAAAHVPLDSELSLPLGVPPKQASPGVTAGSGRSSSSGTARTRTSRTRRSAPDGTKKTPAKRGTGRMSLPTPRSVKGTARGRSQSVVDDESAPAAAKKSCVDDSVAHE